MSFREQPLANFGFALILMGGIVFVWNTLAGLLVEALGIALTVIGLWRKRATGQSIVTKPRQPIPRWMFIIAPAIAVVSLVGTLIILDTGEGVILRTTMLQGACALAAVFLLMQVRRYRKSVA